MTTVLAIDHGNGHVKACSDEKMILLPSCYSRPEEFGVDMVAPKQGLQVFEFKSGLYPGEVYYWGRDVNKAGRIIATYGGEGRYVTKSFRLLSQFAMALLLPDSENAYDDVHIITGCPSVNKGTDLEAEIRQVFNGRHVLSVNGQTKTVQVNQVTILPQPMGTIFNLYFNESGHVVNRQFEENYVGVIDIGSGTTDIDGVKGLKRQGDDIATIQSGIFDAYKKIANYINRMNPNAIVSPQMVEQHLLRPEIDINTYKISNRANLIDITECRHIAFRELAEDILNFIQQMWPNRTKFDAIYLTGGGAKPLSKYFLEWEKDIQVLDDSQQANVSGFHRYGLSLLKR